MVIPSLAKASTPRQKIAYTTAVESEVDTAENAIKAVIGNVLTENQATAGDTLGTTEGFGPGVGSPTFEYVGGKIVVTNISGGSLTGIYVGNSSVNYFSVIPSALHTLTMTVSQPVGSRTLRMTIVWLNSSRSIIGSSNGYTETVTASTRDLFWQATAPSNAAYAYAFIEQRVTGSAGDQIALSRAGFWVGYGGMWTPPGYVVRGINVKTEHPNTDDVLVKVWDADKSREQTVRYDTGTRDFRTLVTGPHAVTGDFHARRVNELVTLHFSSLIINSTGNVTFATLPSGYAPRSGAIAVVNQIVTGVYTPKALNIYSSGALQMMEVATSGSGSFSGTLSFYTDDPIPTVLGASKIADAPYAS